MFAALSSLARPGRAARSGPTRMRTTRIGRSARVGPATRRRTLLLAVTGLPLLAVPWLIARHAPATGHALPDTTPAGSVPTTVAPAIGWLAAAAAVVAFSAGHLLYLARRRRADRAGTDLSGPFRWPAGYGPAVSLVGLAALVVALGGWLGSTGSVLATAVNLAAVAAGAAFLAALLAGPAGAGSGAGLRRALDGAIVGLCLAFGGRTLLAAPLGQPDVATLATATFCCCVLATALLVATSPRTRARGPMFCAVGAAAAMAGLPGLSLGLVRAASGWWLAAAIALLLLASVLVWRGTAALATGQDGPAAGGGAGTGDEQVNRLGDERADSVSRAVIAWPTAMALVALYRLATGGELDRAATILGTLVVLSLGVRLLLANLAVASGARASAPTGGSTVVAVPRPRAQDHAMQPPVQTDPVTGLADRDRLAWSITAMLSAPRRPGALLLIGIDGLDAVPDPARDDVLRDLAGRLRQFVAADGRDGTCMADQPARWSAAELALLTPANLAQAYGLAHGVVTLLAEPVTAPTGTAQLSASVGVTDLAGATGTDDVVRRAQVALRRARQLGPGRVEWYDTAVAEAVARREVLERELPDAVRRGELDLIYQPIIDLDRGRPLAVEALLRWRHPQFGTLLPADVIPVAEESGVIADVDRWALWRALARLAAWRHEDRDLSMAINVSPCTLAAPTFPDEVGAALAAHDLPADRLMVEVAEAEIEEGTALDESVGALRSVGVRVALDAFGTGLASLAHLRRLPIDMVKIGKPFFEDPGGSGSWPRTELPMIDVMVGVGRRLGIDVVAQGVEAPAHLTVVRSAGCRIGQGHLFARPQPAEHTEAYLDGFAVRR